MVRLPPRGILAPYDPVDASDFSLSQAADLARRLGAKIEVLCAKPASGSLSRAAREKLISTIQARGGGAAHVHAADGDFVTAILEAPLSLPVDLIVMDSCDRRGLKDWVSGSPAESVVRQSLLPVLIVRRPSNSIRSILAPVNFADYSETGFFYAARLASMLDARLALLHVAPTGRDLSMPEISMQHLIGKLPEDVPMAARIERHATTGRPESVILAEAERYDLIVLAVHRKSLVQDIFLGTTAEHIVHKSAVPVLTVPCDQIQSREIMEQWARLEKTVNA